MQFGGLFSKVHKCFLKKLLDGQMNIFGWVILS